MLSFYPNPIYIIFLVTVTAGMLQFYGYKQFNAMRHLQVIQIRFPAIVQIEARIVIVVLLVLMPSHLIMRTLEEYNEQNGIWNETGERIHHIAGLTNTALLTFAMFFLCYIEAMRLWLMYYRLKLIVSLKNNEWGSSITSNFWKTDFYLKNRATRGNAKWVGRRGLFYWIPCSVITELGMWYISEYEVDPRIQMTVYTLTLLLFLAPPIFIAFLYRRAPKKRSDNMMIDEEFKMTIYVVAISFIGYMVPLIALQMGYPTIQFVSGYLAMIFSVAAPSLIATLWIPRKLKQHEALRAMERFHGPLVLKEGLFKDRALKPGTETTSYTEELRNLFLNKDKMKAMARWMIRDCTLESFLAFVEMAQFKESVINVVKQRNKHFIDENHDRQRYKFYDHCPKSSIVFNGKLDFEKVAEDDEEANVVLEMEAIQEEKEKKESVHDDREMAPTPSSNQMVMDNMTPMGMLPMNNNKEQVEERSIVLMDVDVHRLKGIAHLLFEKYISTYASLEINIAYGLKGRLYGLERENYASMTPLQWMELYDPVLSELRVYIIQSYKRMIKRFYVQEQEKKKKGEEK